MLNVAVTNVISQMVNVSLNDSSSGYDTSFIVISIGLCNFKAGDSLIHAPSLKCYFKVLNLQPITLFHLKCDQHPKLVIQCIRSLHNSIYYMPLRPLKNNSTDIINQLNWAHMQCSPAPWVYKMVNRVLFFTR